MQIQVASFSSSGGAGNVGRHLTYGFQQLGLDASFYSAMQSNLREEPFQIPLVTSAAALDNYILKSKTWPSLISLTRDRARLHLPLSDETDILILRWGNGLLNRDLITKLGERTLVLGLDDMNYFTGACHYAGECSGFRDDCSGCPAVKRGFRKLVHENLERKKSLLSQVKSLKLVAPTRWMQEEFNQSPFAAFADVCVIPNPLDPVFFEKNPSRIPKGPEPLTVTIVAADLDDPIKGVEAVWPVLRDFIFENRIKLHLIGAASEKLKSKLTTASFRGKLSSKDLVLVFAETDVLLIPSIRENAGTVVSEAASQEVPSISRHVGGLVEEVGDGGWMFRNNEELRSVISNLTRENILHIGQKAKKRAERCSPIGSARGYIEKLGL